MQLQNHIKGYNLLPFEQEFRLYADAVIGLTPTSIKNYVSDYRYFTQWLNAQYNHISPKDAQAVHIEAYRAYLIQQGLPRSSVNRRLSALRALYSFLLEQQMIDSNPMKSIKNMTLHMSQPNIHQSYSFPADPKATSQIVSEFCTETSSKGLDAVSCQRLSSHIEEFIHLTQFQFQHETA